MGEINKIIDDFFEDAAWTLVCGKEKEIYGESTEEKIVKKFVLTATLRRFDDIQTGYLSMLDDIDKLVCDKIDEKNSYVSYYKDKALLKTDVNVSGIIEELKHNCDGSEISEKLVDRIKKALLKKNGYKRIAQIYHYKKNHKSYEKMFEKTYREIVNEVIGKDKEYFFTINAVQEIEKRTKEIVGSAVKNAYDKICGYKHIPEKYKLNKEDYVLYMDRFTVPYVCIANDSQCFPCAYYDKVYSDCQAAEYLDLAKCYEDFSFRAKSIKSKLSEDEYSFLENNMLYTYKRYFKGVFSYIAGFDENTIDGLREENDGRRIISLNMMKEINLTIIMLMLITKKDKDFYKKENCSRFSTINNPAHLTVVKKSIQLYRELIKVAIIDEKAAERFINKHELSADKEELRIIESVDVNIDIEGMLNAINKL